MAPQQATADQDRPAPGGTDTDHLPQSKSAKATGRRRGRRRKSPNGAGGTTLRPDGRWMARISVEDPETGLAVRKTFYGRSEGEARRKMVQALAAESRGTLLIGRGRGLTLTTWARQWLSALEGNLRPKTVLRYRELLELHVIPLLGPYQLIKLSPTHVNGLLKTKRSAGLKSRTCNRVRDVLRNCLNEAIRQGHIGRNVAQLARPLPLNDVGEMKFLRPAQVSRFLESAGRHPEGDLWIIAVATASRLSELQGLTWDNVDLTAGKIRITRSLQRLNRQWIVQDPKTERSRRPISLPQVAVDAFQRQRARQDSWRSASERWDEKFGDLVFTTATGEPLQPTSVSRRLGQAMEEAGLPRLRFHDLRHSAASFLNAMKVPHTVVSQVLGHSQVSTTLNIYTHVFEELSEEAATAMNRALSAHPFP